MNSQEGRPPHRGTDDHCRTNLIQALLLSLEADTNLDLAARNNPRLKVVRALGVSIVDLLDHETVVVSEAALMRLSEVLAL